MPFLATACLFETGFSGNPRTPLGACPCLFLEYTGGLEDVGYCLVWDPYGQQASSDLYSFSKDKLTAACFLHRYGSHSRKEDGSMDQELAER